jgi:hypothetical protein
MVNNYVNNWTISFSPTVKARTCKQPYINLLTFFLKCGECVYVSYTTKYMTGTFFSLNHLKNERGRWGSYIFYILHRYSPGNWRLWRGIGLIICRLSYIWANLLVMSHSQLLFTRWSPSWDMENCWDIKWYTKYLKKIQICTDSNWAIILSGMSLERTI